MSFISFGYIFSKGVKGPIAALLGVCSLLEKYHPYSNYILPQNVLQKLGKYTLKLDAEIKIVGVVDVS